MPASLSVVVPYYNEAGFLPATLKSLVDQTHRPFSLILIDNGSSDGSRNCCDAALAGACGIKVVHFTEARPGKVHALELALDHVDTELVALCDADTYYPPHYLATGIDILATAGPGVAARIILGCEIVTGATACALGLVQWSVPEADLATFAGAVSERIGALPAHAVAAAKSCLAATRDPSRDGFAEEIDATKILVTTERTRELVAAFLEGRR